jgi:hypothetical protein
MYLYSIRLIVKITLNDLNYSGMFADFWLEYIKCFIKFVNRKLKQY